MTTTHARMVRPAKTMGCLAVLLAAASAGAAPSAPVIADSWSQPAFMLTVGGVPFDIGNPALGGHSPVSNGSIGGDAYGHAAPFMADLDGDAKRDLVVGSFSGRFRLYRNISTDAAPQFPKEFTWLKAGEQFAHVHIFCCVASGPQLVDLDGDGVLDLSSGSYDPGSLYWFKGLGKDAFAPRQILTETGGIPVLAHPETLARLPQDSYMSNLSWVDWNEDGRLDVIFGDMLGELFVRKAGEAAQPSVLPMPNQPVFAPVYALQKSEIRIEGQKAIPDRHAAPAVADWDGDGLWDILVGSESGAVYLLRNSGKAGKPEFKAREILLSEGPGGTEQWVEPGQEGAMKRGIRSQIQAVDYNRDGKLDLLVGTWSTSMTPRSDLTKAERKHLQALRATLAALDEQVGFKYKTVRGKSPGYYQNPELEKKSNDTFKQMLPYLVHYHGAREPDAQGYIFLGNYIQDHGHVWVFLRK